MDVRYNVIQWVHRSTRGWSYGSSVTDPRTGEIIKGHVSLGSLRIRQDFLIAQALMDKPFADRDDNYQPMLDLALARIRQLSAHEIGHTLGFAHNFAASSNGRASVMDYPHPQFILEEGEIDFSNAYAVGIGAWDKVIVAYSYSDFGNEKEVADSTENEGLNRILEKAYKDGLRYITDQDARPEGGAHAAAHLWDNGETASKELEDVLAIRSIAIENFSIDNIRKGEPNSVLEDVFAPLYFLHRYQTEATAKVVGGLSYNYTVKGDNQGELEVIDKETQGRALKTILKTLDAQEMAIPKDKLTLFPPRAFGYPRSRESIKGRTGVSFDALSAPETAADMTLGFLLHPERASRLIQQKALDTKNLGLGDVLDAVIDNSIKKESKENYISEVQNNINFRVLFYLMNLAASDAVHPQVNAIASQKINSLAGDSDKSLKNNPIAAELQRRIHEFYEHPEQFKIIPTTKIPDGSPIGMDCFD